MALCGNVPVNVSGESALKPINACEELPSFIIQLMSVTQHTETHTELPKLKENVSPTKCHSCSGNLEVLHVGIKGLVFSKLFDPKHLVPVLFLSFNA